MILLLLFAWTKRLHVLQWLFTLFRAQAGIPSIPIPCKACTMGPCYLSEAISCHLPLSYAGGYLVSPTHQTCSHQKALTHPSRMYFLHPIFICLPHLLPTFPSSSPNFPRLSYFLLFSSIFSARQRFSLTHMLSVYSLSLPRECELREGRFNYLQYPQGLAYRRCSCIYVSSTSVSGKYHAPPMVFYLTHSTWYINTFTLVD